ncbi:MAG: hypothetical protein MUP48_03255 [Wolbachia endosymbiont of Homalodisca vitripennis]|nr:hypothetical protein [Wolbachia endosymbiont of Homalodisca vitripennis]MBR9984123.1 hypothetical protein [Wolbachia endosymbiont of Homalodisca vitripennis]MCJ7454458.1 hypothetical protein [Wolbachia endosymbiont of Homalodisca vitripennis]MCJ7475569.1 hypothetical protein [Wolbachia endosymbiont of Homalodisca vitripennis]
MKKYTFEIDDKNPLYKKLIELPTTYYRLKHNNNKYTIHSHIGTAELGDDTNGLKLKKQGDKIFLYKGASPLKVHNTNGEVKDLVIEQGDIISEKKSDILETIKTQEINIVLKEGSSTSDFALGLSYLNDDLSKLTGILSFIDFYNEDDPVLQKIKGKEGRLYFTIEEDNIFVSDKNGNCLPVCKDGSCYKYQYTKNKHDIEISEISKIIESLTKTKECSISETTENSIKAGQSLTLQQEEKLSEDNMYEAENGKCISTLPKIVYHMFNNEFLIHNYTTKEKEVEIPRDFHYLKVVQSSSNDDYQLTFCNFLGNEFFEHKKYDPQYSNVSDEYKYISLNCMRKEYKPNFCKLLNHEPSFFITEGTTNPNCPCHYSADIYELTSSGKGRKMATLIDQSYSLNEDCDCYTNVEVLLS